MKVLWLCNIILPIIAKERGEKIEPYGGWLSGLLDSLAERSDVIVCFPYLFPSGNTENMIRGKAGAVDYIGFRESDGNTALFFDILRACQPDLIHIWGTEYRHTLDMVNAAEQANMLDRTVINIQGLVSIIGKYHYHCALPEAVCKSVSLAEIVRKNSIEHGKLSFEARGEYEIAALKKVHHVIGRTDWDEACTKQINPKLHYHFCNESLRSSFYEHQWDPVACERHSIFLSQSNYPLKGFHLMLEAMPLILARFPDAQIYTTGEKPKEPGVLENLHIKGHAYPMYIRSLIKKYGLEDHVSFVGLLNEEAMCERFLRSHVFVSPSSIENSSNSICEAMLLGMPVVSSDVGGIKNLLEHGRDGYIYQWDAPYMLAWYVCKVFEDQDRAVEMGQRARARALVTHDRRRNLQDMLNIYEEICADTKQSEKHPDKRK